MAWQARTVFAENFTAFCLPALVFELLPAFEALLALDVLPAFACLTALALLLAFTL